ncbi:MAG: translation initiation factor IF-2 N-terminal domain-containing protein, partial [Anaerolineales bacterium]
MSDNGQKMNEQAMNGQAKNGQAMNGQEIKTIELPSSITVRDLANKIESSPIEVIKNLMANGVMANINQQIDFDTAAIVAAEMGYEAQLETLEDVREDEKGEIPLWRRIIA